eukprot:COSAG06_NODE_38352_length_424_cov_2.040000_1_plen_101_part_10
MAHLNWIKECFNERFTSEAGPPQDELVPRLAGRAYWETGRAGARRAGVREGMRAPLAMPPGIDRSLDIERSSIRLIIYRDLPGTVFPRRARANRRSAQPRA